MEHKAFPSLGEDLYTETLPNGLRLQVIPKPGFRSCYAVLAVNYGGAFRRFRLDGEDFDTPAGAAQISIWRMPARKMETVWVPQTSIKRR